MSSSLDRYGFILAVFLFALLALSYNNAFSTDDDVYISLRYAQNMADGYGLVFNPHQQPVEGYTNFLWTLILAGAAAVKLPLPILSAFLSVFSTILLFITITIIAHRQREFTPRFPISLPVILLASFPSIALWSTTGMETLFFSWLIMMGVLAIGVEERKSRPGYLSGVIWALAALTRPEGIAIGLLVMFMSHVENPKRWQRHPALFQRLAGFLIPVAAHVVFRKLYYGEWLPNTFYAKTTPTGDLVPNGIIYLKGFLAEGGLALLILLVVGLLIRPKISGLWTILVTSSFYLGYTVWIGGDWMAANRLYVPILPLLVLGASAVIAKFKHAVRWFGYAVGILLFLHILISGYIAQKPFQKGSTLAQRVLGDPEPVDVLTELGIELRRITERTIEQETLAVIPAGKVPFYSGLRAIDMRGLCDHHIAHSDWQSSGGTMLTGHIKRDPDYVLDQEPDFIVLTGAKRKPDKPLPPITVRPGKIADKWTIIDHPEFKRCYEAVTVHLENGDKDLLYFQRTCPKVKHAL